MSVWSVVTLIFSLLILTISIFSVGLARSLSIFFFWPFQRTSSLFHYPLLFSFNFIDFCSWTFPSFLLLWVCFALLFVASGDGSLDDGFETSFLEYALSTLNFPLSTAFAVTHNFYVVFPFSFSSLYFFLISFETSFLIHRLFRSCLVSFQLLGDFIIPLLISNLSSLRSQNTPWMISIFLNLLRFKAHHMIILVTIPWTLKNVYSSTVGKASINKIP